MTNRIELTCAQCGGTVVLITDRPVKAAPVSPAVAEEDSRLLLSIENLELSCRAYNGIRRIEPRVETIGQLIDHTEKELLRIKHMGKISVREIIGELSRHGLELARR